MASLSVRPEAGVDDPRGFAAEMMAMAAAASAAHRHAASVAAAAPADLARAEAVHFFTLLHAERPSAATVAAAVDPDRWVAGFALRFETERSWLGRIAIAGAAPSRAELTRHELVVHAQREAMLTLAKSDRAGCALGAVAALAADWPAVRAALAPGERVGVDRGVGAAIEAAATSPAARRAIGFGVAQMLAVHRTLWDLLEARQATSLP